MLEHEILFVWRKYAKKPEEIYIHCVEYKYDNTEHKEEDTDDWGGKVTEFKHL